MGGARHPRARRLLITADGGGIRHVIAVASGKGGVGKSTVSVNLALALQQAGGRVGLLDADILGPSIPVMLGLATGQPPATTADQKIVPAERYGLKAISMGMLTGDDQPAILRGPMVGKYLNMFIGTVQWGPLDYLILDFPPGTGDTQLTLAQSVPLSGAIIVTTPQDVSLKIAHRGRLVTAGRSLRAQERGKEQGRSCRKPANPPCC